MESDNRLMKLILKVATASLPPGFLHPCPYTVSRKKVFYSRKKKNFNWILIKIFIHFQQLSVENFYLNTALASLTQIVPSGDYRTSGGCYTENDEVLGTANSYLSVISPDKQSFG